MRNTISVIGMPSAAASQQSGPSEGLSEAIIAEVGRQKGQLSELSLQVGKKYEKPADGIPSTDLAGAVQASISRADTIYDDYIDAQNLM